MKRLSIFYILILTLFACSNDETKVMIRADVTPPKINAPISDATVVITPEVLNDMIDFSWSETGYGVSTEVIYTLEADVLCNSFSKPVVIGTTTSNSLSVSFTNLNSKLVNDLKIAPHQQAEVQLRVTSVIKNNYQSVSDLVTITITPTSDYPLALWMGENSADAPTIYATSETTYEGYRYLNKDMSFRFSDNPVCVGLILGSNGTEGNLSSSASSSNIAIGTSGYYKINVDTENLTYSLTLIETWGMIGTATPGGWGSSTVLTYNASSQTWESTIDLVSGALKFRANNDWGINYGPADSNVLDGTLLLDDPGAISIQESGNYTVIIDFSKTKSINYTYSIIKNAANSKPAELWLPGEYQGWNPSAAPTIKAINSSSFEGYVYISAPTGYKFTSSPDWDHINYGDAGAGMLTTDGLANGLGLAQAGYYKFNVNVDALTYSATLINTMGMIGTSTPGSWDSSSPMTYDQPNNVWKGTINLVPGALKFRANNEWTINYGPADGGALTGSLIFDDPGAINITEAGNYTVTVDFSKSVSPYKYTYKIVKN